MIERMPQVRWTHVLLVLMLVAAYAFTQEESALSIITQPAEVSVVPRDSSATLSCVAEKGNNNISYQWYLSVDGSVKNSTPIDGANKKSYTTKSFRKKEILYYYCLITAGDEKVLSNIVAVAYTGLPILYINTKIPIDSVTKDSYVLGDMRLLYEGGETFAYEFKKEKEGIKGRGNSSWGKPKKGYNIRFDKKQSVFGLPAAEKWCIIANYTDKTLLRNKFASVLGNEIYNSNWNPHFTSVDVVWNGEYRGNYIFGEKVTLGVGRVNVQDISDYGERNVEFEKFTDQNGDGEVDLYDGGFLIELDKRDDAKFMFLTTKEMHVALKDPEEVPENIQNHVKLVIQKAEDVLYSGEFADTQKGWRKYFDEKTAIDWDIVNIFAPNPDLNFASIFRYYNPSDGKLYFGPLWDFDLGFANRSENGSIPQWELPSKWYNNIWIKRMHQDSSFFANFVSRWNEKREVLRRAINVRLQELADANAVSAECNFLKWKILGEYVKPNNSGAENRKTYQSEIDYMADYMRARFDWLDDAINSSFFISYDLDGGYLEKNNGKVFVSQSTAAFTLNNPKKYGYTFVGWSGRDIDGLSMKVKVTDDKTGNKRYTAHWIRDFSVKDVSICDVSFKENEFVYGGVEIKPQVAVFDAGKELVLGTDYIVKYEDNIAAGEAKAVVSGIGEYSGKYEKKFLIAPKPITLSVTNVSKFYGEKDPALNYAIEGLLPKDDAGKVMKDINFMRKLGEDVGEYIVTVTFESVENTNYSVNVKNGLLTIKPDTSKIVVRVVGNSDTVEYNGKEYVVHGFNMKSSDEIYSINFVNYTGDSIVYGSAAKTYPMELTANDFKNMSANFSNVSFDVTDGSLVILPQNGQKTLSELQNKLNLSADRRRIRVQGAILGEHYVVFDVQGVVVQTGTVERECFDVPVLNAGIYMVYIGPVMQSVRVR